MPSWKKTKDSRKKTHLPILDCVDRQGELELPPKMAAGFACMLGGSLIMIVPGAQSVGLTLIGTGLALALDGMANGEQPYYIDSITREKLGSEKN